MSRARPGLHRLTATGHARRRLAWLMPLTVLSAVSTVQVVSSSTSGDSGDLADATLAEGIRVPTSAVNHPSSYSIPGRISLSVPRARAGGAVAATSTSEIPSAALAAYQRAETVINAADKSCRVPWQLIAAIGRVESDHGRYGGNTLGADGVSRPGIFGIPLDGTRGTAEISDTDAGQLDNDKVWDRAVGPMQFIPSTWWAVGVDADGDSERNPQDIDDAALASGVYLCSGDDNLSTEAGQRRSVYRYNHSAEYVDLVLSIAEAYMAGGFTSVPNHITSAHTFTPDYSVTSSSVHRSKKGANSVAGPAGGTPGPVPPSGDDTAQEPGNDHGGQSDEPDASDAPTTSLSETVAETTTKVTETISEPADTVVTLLTLPKAILKCTSLGYSALLTPTRWRACISRYTTGS